MDDGSFLRQRRNVFVVCSALWVLCLGGVNLDKLTLAGMQFNSFDRPEVFLYGAWLAFGYFTYRFIVYFMEDSPGEVSRFYWREMERVVSPRLRDIVLREHPKTSTRVTYTHLRQCKRTYKGQRMESRSEHGRTFEQVVNFEMPVPKSKTLWWELRGFLRFAALTPALTDHVLPLVLAAFTLTYCGFVASWKGSLVPIVRGLLGLG